jgi:hypothetical protein
MNNIGKYYYYLWIEVIAVAVRKSNAIKVHISTLYYMRI